MNELYLPASFHPSIALPRLHLPRLSSYHSPRLHQNPILLYPPPFHLSFSLSFSFSAYSLSLLSPLFHFFHILFVLLLLILLFLQFSSPHSLSSDFLRFFSFFL